MAACGAEPKAAPEPTVSLPTGNVEVPAGVSLTKPGKTLEFGEAATIAYEPNPGRSSVLTMEVDRVRQGSIADLSAFQLDEQTKKATPYYVTVRVTNVGTGDLGKSPIPLWVVDGDNTLIQASSFTTSFKRCPSTPLPETFGPSAATKACLIYLVPNKGRVTGVSYRPLQAFEPILWEGDVEPAASPATEPTKPTKPTKPIQPTQTP